MRKNKSERILLTEYARRKGVSHTSVRKAINAEKIVHGYETEGRYTYIYPSIADAEWAQHYNPNYDRKTRAGSRPFEGEELPPPPATPAAASGASDASVAAAKKAQQILKAKILELEYKEKQGTLVDKAKVYATLFSFGKELRGRLLNIPDRIVDDIRAADSRTTAFNLLYDEISRALDELTDIEKRPLVTDR